MSQRLHHRHRRHLTSDGMPQERQISSAPCWPHFFTMSGGGVTRVSIPHNARMVIQEIKKTIGSKNIDGFVYTTSKTVIWILRKLTRKGYGVTNHQERDSRLIVTVDSGNVNNGAHVANSVSNGNGTLAVSNGSYSDKVALAPESSSTSDTVVVSSKITCAVGTIQCEIVKCSGSTKSNSRLPAGTGIKLKELRSLKPLSLSAVSPNKDNQPPQLLHEPVSGCGEKGVEKSRHQAVIFPNHLQVPENYKSQLTFGGFDEGVEKSRTFASAGPVGMARGFFLCLSWHIHTNHYYSPFLSLSRAMNIHKSYMIIFYRLPSNPSSFQSFCKSSYSSLIGYLRTRNSNSPMVNGACIATTIQHQE
ncbi:unnamed protein product [Lactuca saligna]|uniref:Uncharacterized protein n=1 Tax=Lactuca saligna TaxID=75948 RepID=A0AA35Z0R6_LACSI|nr:unnamed protein product [Lactuca saligna]